MKYIQWYHDDFVNGEGIREVIFVPGCAHYCKGCFNSESWDFNQGEEFTNFSDLKERLDKKYCSGITITGGDPLYSYEEVLEFCKQFKNYNIWLYTGFIYEEVLEKFKPILEYINVIVTGPFIESLKCPKTPWIGSSNQKIIYLNE